MSRCTENSCSIRNTPYGKIHSNQKKIEFLFCGEIDNQIERNRRGFNYFCLFCGAHLSGARGPNDGKTIIGIHGRSDDTQFFSICLINGSDFNNNTNHYKCVPFYDFRKLERKCLSEMLEQQSLVMSNMIHQRECIVFALRTLKDIQFLKFPVCILNQRQK
mmetsp:Transcript_9933/g.24768  ORF Transcript_9933/g.24768 Transcript_9933/m.24768 type:complete len:161 (-) Transcript_9933:2122-2604(-)